MKTENKVSDRERAVLVILAKYYGQESNCLYMKYIAKETKLTIIQVRRSLRALAKKGYAEFVRGLFDDDGKVAGSGYCATREGALITNACIDCKKEISETKIGVCDACFTKRGKECKNYQPATIAKIELSSCRNCGIDKLRHNEADTQKS